MFSVSYLCHFKLNLNSKIHQNNLERAAYTTQKVPADLVIFSVEILNGKLHFFVQCSG